jgi:hypothetical protein
VVEPVETPATVVEPRCNPSRRLSLPKPGSGKLNLL